MVTDIDKQAIDLLGLKNANVITDIIERWIFIDYLSGENAFLVLCVGKSDETATYSSSWFDDNNDLSDQDLLMSIALSSFASLPEKYKIKERHTPYMFFGLDTEDLDIECKAYKIEMTALWLEKLTIYAFAICNSDTSPNRLNQLLFELDYALCRTLAPKSDRAWDLVNNSFPFMSLEQKGSPKLEKFLIHHVERAFCCNLFPSIKAWKK